MANVAIQLDRFVVLHFKVLSSKNRNYCARSTLSDTIVCQFLPLNCIRSMRYDRNAGCIECMRRTLTRNHLQTHIILLSGPDSLFPICDDLDMHFMQIVCTPFAVCFLPSTRSAHNKNITDLFWNRTAATNCILQNANN